MVFLIRVILVSLVVYLLIRSFIMYFSEEEEVKSNEGNNHIRNDDRHKGVSKEIGEYVDYEEVHNDKNSSD